MAFTSIGYDGTVNERQWAELVPSVGSSTYGIKEADDLKVTAVPGQPLMVSVASGTAWGHGVMDTETANTTITCDSISSGSRWDLISLRRDWQPLAGGPTSVAKVTGTAERVIPSARQAQPGVIDDQPLALVQWTAGQTQPTQIVDLRCWARNGGVVAVDDLVRTYLDAVGTRLSIKGIDWVRAVGANDVPEWVDANRGAYAKALGRGVLNAIPAGNPHIGPVPVAFPPGRFTVAPVITSLNSDQTRVNLAAADVTTAGFSLYATNVTTTDSGAGTFRWGAEQMTATSAVG